MLKAYKFRIYPDRNQAILLHKHFGSTRFLYNYFLDYRQKEYVKGNNKVTYSTTQALLTELKHKEEYIWLNECASQSLQMALRELDTAYDNFFKKRADYPKYKSKKNIYQSATFPQNINVDYDNKKVFIPKFMKDGIKTKFHRQIPKSATIKRATISRKNDRYYIAIIFEDNIPLPKPIKAKNAVGLDMGISSLIATSDYVKYPNLKTLAKYEKKLKLAQKRLDKKQHSRKKGDTTPKSNNYLKQQKKVRNIHEKIANIREDYLHKISTEIINQYDIVCLETLNIKGMMKNHKLAKQIADVSWGKFITMLEYKASWQGKTILKIDRWFPSSQLCSNCGTNNGKKPLSIRKWTCPDCGYIHDRDINAAINIRNYGLGQVDDRNRTGTVRSACGASSDGANTSYGILASHGVMKQEAQSSLAIG